jgi:hypothetical protein
LCTCLRCRGPPAMCCRHATPHSREWVLQGEKAAVQQQHTASDCCLALTMPRIAGDTAFVIVVPAVHHSLPSTTIANVKTSTHNCSSRCLPTTSMRDGTVRSAARATLPPPTPRPLAASAAVTPRLLQSYACLPPPQAASQHHADTRHNIDNA